MRHHSSEKYFQACFTLFLSISPLFSCLLLNPIPLRKLNRGLSLTYGAVVTYNTYIVQISTYYLVFSVAHQNAISMYRIGLERNGFT